MSMLDTAPIRVQIKMFDRQCHDLLMKMDRVGARPDLLKLYEAADTKIIQLRMELVEMLRQVVPT